MKKTLFRISMVAILTLSMQLGYSHKAKVEKGFYFSWPKARYVLEMKNSYAYYLGLYTEENFKAYHTGLKMLFPTHHLPTFEEMLNSIYNHSEFYGILSKEQALKKVRESAKGLVVFRDKKTSHFYIAHRKGFRHFSVNTVKVGNANAGKLDNLTGLMYPNIDHLLECTKRRYLLEDLKSSDNFYA